MMILCVLFLKNKPIYKITKQNSQVQQSDVFVFRYNHVIYNDDNNDDKFY